MNSITLKKFLVLLSLLFVSCSTSIEYSINFDSNGGTLVDTIKTDGKSSVSFPNDPTREGYSFLGWYLDDNTFNIPFTSNSFVETPILDDITVYADWFALSYNITFITNGGSSVDNLMFNTNQTIQFPPNPTKIGFLFSGWYMDIQLETKFTKKVMPPNDLALYAKWVTPYEAFYNSLNIKEIDYSWDDDDIPFKNYIFYSYDGDDVSSEQIYFYKDGQISYVYYYRSGSLSSNGTIYEQTWVHSVTTHIDDVKSFKLVMHERRVTKKPNLPQTEINYRSEATNGKLLNTTTYSASYTFNNNSWKSINHNDNPNDIIFDFYFNLKQVFPNVFTINQFTISFSLNGGNPIQDLTLEKNSILNIPVPVKIGHTFQGWFTDAALTQEFDLARMPPYNFTLYAKWSINQYSIFFETNGGSLIERIYGNYGDVVTIPDDPVREEASFIGWFFDTNLTLFAEVPTTIPANNLTLYAKWDINQYTINFETNGGNNLPQQNYEFNDILTIIPPTKIGSTFSGWYTDPELNDQFLFSTMPSYDLTLYAKWTVNQYKISYNSIIFDRLEKVSAGASHNLALTKSGSIYVWGLNNYGQLGDGTLANRNKPSQVKFNELQNGEIIQSISAGENHSLAITTSGRVFSWGLNNYGQLGDGTLANRNTPSQVKFDELQNGEIIQSISAGENHSLAITTSGRVFSWGLNNYGQLGDGTLANRNTPSQVIFNELQSGEIVRDLSLGDSHSLALTTFGRVFSWGWNAGGQLGDGTTVNKFNPKLISIPSLANGEIILEISAGNVHSHAISSNGRVFAWGWNGSGQLGDGTTIQRNAPTLINFTGLQFDETMSSISANLNGASIAQTSKGRIFTWGFNGNGQLGQGSTTSKSNPQLINFQGLQSGEVVSSFDLGSYHLIVITSYGRVFTAGFNGTGQLANGSTTTTNTLLPTLQNVTIISNNGLVDEYLILIFNQTITLNEPSLEGYLFQGWFLDENLTIPFILSTMPDSNLLLYAWFTPISN